MKEQKEKMFPHKIYEIAKDLGLNKKDIDNILSTPSLTYKDNIAYSSPTEVYKIIGRYGTVSIKDFNVESGVNVHDRK